MLNEAQPSQPRKERTDMTDVVMPQMGESIVEGTLTKWLKKPGERVERDEPLFEISTDKVDTEIPSPAAGTLAEVLVEEGKTVGINTVVARIDEGDGGRSALRRPKPAAPPAAAAAGTAPSAAPAPTAAAAAAAARAAAAEPAGPLSPLVRKMARENNIDLSRVQRHRRRRAHHQAGRGGVSGADAPAAPPAPPRQPAAGCAAPPASAAGQPSAAGPARTRIEPLSTMRAKIAEHMVLSKRTSAHVTTIHRVDMTKVAQHARAPQGRLPGALRLLADLPAVHRARRRWRRCAQFPLLNASIDGNNIVYHNEINIGIAVALENGLIVPVIRDADEKNVLGLQRSIVDLADARPLAPAQARRGAGRHVLHHQFRQLRQPDRHARSSTSRRWPSWAWARWIRRRWWSTTPSPSAPSATSR